MQKEIMNVMKKIIAGVTAFALGLLTQQITQAQGTMTYLSNLSLTSAGSLAVGSDSWYAALFITGPNSSGYTLDSIQLAMTDASGTPSGFMAMVYNGIFGGTGIEGSIGTLDGSLNPAAGGIYTFTPDSNLTLSANTSYYVVLTAGTTVANGAYEWSYAGTSSYNPIGGWSSSGNTWSSTNGRVSALSWQPTSSFTQFAINVTDAPEPGVLGLFGLGGVAFLWYRRKTKAVQ
jgi:hypothetical protein